MDRDIRVLEVFGEPIANGGQESFVFQVIEHMDLSGIKIDVLTPYQCQNKAYEEIVKRHGGSVVALNLSFRPGKSRNSVLGPFSAFLKDHSYDVIHIHSGSISILALCALAGKINDVPRVIVHSHCAAESETLKHRIVKCAMTPLLDWCPTDYCACSQVAAQWKFSNRSQRKVKIIKNGVDLERFSFSHEKREATRRKLGIANSLFVIGHVGRFSYQKNHNFLIDAFSKFTKENPDSVLLLVGEGELKTDIIQKTKNLGLEDKVLFCGSTNHVEDYYNAMDVFALPSRYEGLPIVGVEAQANGLVTLVSDNVSRELELTEQVRYLDTNNVADWVDETRKAVGMKRYSGSVNRLRKQGYDINQTGKEIRELYLKK